MINLCHFCTHNVSDTYLFIQQIMIVKRLVILFILEIRYPAKKHISSQCIYLYRNSTFERPLYKVYQYYDMFFFIVLYNKLFYIKFMPFLLTK